MKSKPSYFLLAAVMIPLWCLAQDLKSNLFLRTPQVVNYNFNQSEISYSPIISIGTGFSHKSKFIEIATFMGSNDIYGCYTFFGTTLKTKKLQSNLNLNINWFGEVTFVPNQDQNSDSLIYTSGICFFLNHGFEWGSIGIPLCLGAAFNNKTIRRNTRTIFNLSLNLN
ncbi:hypothetical protein [Flagellimonas meridianipacifica]|uniref:Outer membrane protein with beta-barrel domain n=1 Tax=Flagellimonas meridianipacifica TaxID=1080225 RepID=A0A2T0M9T0_9FLAO|nr:hypothetical protein [Allomuricauda pacifica]PRX54182.1 hypothetical protein CLV81_2579 [Allomuricauda pacifica]